MSTLSFERQMQNAVGVINARYHSVYRAITDHLAKSILYGSAVTGAPGQPVDTRRLLESWRIQRGDESFRIFTNLFYAPIIEDNRRGAQLRSKVGGFHSLKLTRAGYKAVVRYELAIVKRKIRYEGGGRYRSMTTGQFVSVD